MIDAFPYIMHADEFVKGEIIELKPEEQVNYLLHIKTDVPEEM